MHSGNRISDIQADHDHIYDHFNPSSPGRAFILGIVLNSVYVVAEAASGFYYDSIGLLSDAAHNLGDVASLVLAMIAYRLSKRRPNQKYTYGYRKATIQASLANAVILYIAVGGILVESIGKITDPVIVNGDAMAWVAGIGVVINAFTAWLFMSGKERDLNIKGAFLHMASDTLVSIGVVISGITIKHTGWYIIDPIIGLVIASVIAVSSKGLLTESMRLSLDGVPSGIDINKLEQDLGAIPSVRSVHHLHVWALGTTIDAMTVHLVIDDVNKINQIVNQAREVARKLGIDHSTIETETQTADCDHMSDTINPEI